MSEISITQRQQEQVRRLARLSSELAAGLAENRARLQDHLASADRQCGELTKHLDEQSFQTLSELEDEYNKQLEAARVTFESRVESLEQQRGKRSDQLSQQRAVAIAAAIEDFETTDLRLRDRRIHDAEQLKKQHDQFVGKCQTYVDQLTQLQNQAQSLLRRRGVGLPTVELNSLADDDKAWSSTLVRTHEDHVQRVLAMLTDVKRRGVSRYLDEGWSILLLLGVLLVSAWPCGLVTSFAPLPWLMSVIACSLLSTFTAYQLAHRIAAGQLCRLAPEIAHQIAASDRTVRQAVRALERETKSGLEELRRQCSEEAVQAVRTRQGNIEAAEATFQRDTAELERAFAEHHAQLERTWETDTDQIRSRYLPRLDDRRAFFDKQKNQALQQATTSRDRAEQQFEQERRELQQRWTEAIAEFERFSDEVQQRCAPIVAHLPADDLAAWEPPTAPPEAVPLGHYALTLPAQPEGASKAATVTLPTLLSFPHDASLLLKCDGGGRDAAVQVLQNATLRLLSSFPAGKLRLTIFDPLGLGQNFSAFMHLADYDERLVGNRIWTEASHINQRLMDLTEHMENVIQKYLRNEFPSIQAYNERAGEVAEPFRVLVIANYPHQFTEEATRRLASIAASGPQCGVYTLMSVDMTTKLPKDAQWDDLQRNAQVFGWQQDHFVNQREPFAELPLSLDLPPDNATLTQIVKAVGQRAQETRRVQVPFATIAPAAADIWSADCANELIIPLGRSGATQTQSLRLGHGTSQHVLIAGKTGSGKSTLLHALITNAALSYSPDQVQFFLIDFKKGVEFKAYADYRLPHARVIAIESEREFGLSVLHRLDQELRRRGDIFRDAGVQTLAAYRRGNRNTRWRD